MGIGDRGLSWTGWKGGLFEVRGLERVRDGRSAPGVELTGSGASVIPSTSSAQLAIPFAKHLIQSISSFTPNKP